LPFFFHQRAGGASGIFEMNSDIDRLQPYPFQKLAGLFQGITCNPAYDSINLTIGEPKHATPAFIRDALTAHLDGLAVYPSTLGSPSLREAIARWLCRRYRLSGIDAQTQVIPVNGSREALFALAQAVVDRKREEPVVVCPNPFYQIYEGAALLAGAKLAFLNLIPENGFAPDFRELEPEVWRCAQLVYLCSPNNPTGAVLTLEEWEKIFALSDRYGFVIAADECYSEIYFDEDKPPLGALQASEQLGRQGFPRLVSFGSLSKRSNVPGMRSGFVAGDAAILQKFLLYRTYHGCAMNPAVAHASEAAWQDEAHVRENRQLYRSKFSAVTPMLKEVMQVEMPQAAFYLWAHTPVDDREFARVLYRDYNVAVLPGSFLAREAHGINPGQGFVRIALVPPQAQCAEAARRIQHCVRALTGASRDVPLSVADSRQEL
jgi:N-succinyldiaminopimelate aminotransferase